MNKPNDLDFESGIDLKIIFSTFWAGKFFIICSILIALILASLYLRSAERKFTVEYKLNAVSAETERSAFSRYGGLASLAGIQLPNSNGDDFNIFVQLLASLEVSEKVFKNKNLIKNLFSSEWSEQVGKFTEIEKNSRIEGLKPLLYFMTGSTKKEYVSPNARRLAEFISDEIVISHDKNNGILTLRSQSSKPEDILLLIVEMANASDEVMRERYINFSEGPLNFYKKKISFAKSREHKEALAQLIAKEEQKLMLASSSKYFIAKPVMKPTLSMNPTQPKPKIVLVMSFLLGLLFGVFIVLFRSFLKESDL